MNGTVAYHTDTKPEYKKDRILYVLQAMVEYFITIAVGTTYLAKVAMEIGMSDSAIALLTSVLNFSCIFQLLSIPLNKYKHPKRWMTPSLILIEISFTLIYIIPTVPIPQGVRPILLVIAVILGNSLHNVNCSPKSSWMIGFVADDRRGKFTSYLQIISLVGGIIFSYMLGAVIDAYEARGDMRGAFIVSGIIVAAMSLIHVILFISTKEIPNDSFVEVSVMSQIKSIISNKNLMKIMPIYFIYYISAMCATPFYSTYQIKELGFSMSFIALLSAISAAVRSLASIFCGRYGDKRGFMRLLNICYILMAVAFFINIFTTPSNGKVFYTIYLIIHSVALAGTGIADTNLIYEYAPLDTRVGVMAIKGTVCGAISFVVTLLMSGLVSYIQESGNSFLGMNLYAQQVVSAIAFIGIVLLIVYINTVAITAKNRHEA